MADLIPAVAAAIPAPVGEAAAMAVVEEAANQDQTFVFSHNRKIP